MKERPILFSGPMVRAIQDGRKTQTRRVVKNDPPTVIRDIQTPQEKTIVPEWYLTYCPYGWVGDRLWVRETWADVSQCRHFNHLHGDRQVIFKATDENCGAKWKPSIHMPRWASRITLEITGVRVERVQDISREDVRSEGVPDTAGDWKTGCPMDGHLWDNMTFLEQWRWLWQSINGDESWASNPLVWVIEFRRITP